MSEDFITQLELLFARFYISTDGKRSAASLFAHMDADEGSREELLYAADRNSAQKELEDFFIKSVSDGVWDEFFLTHHYWRSVKHPRLVVCRDWKIFQKRYGNKKR